MKNRLDESFRLVELLRRIGKPVAEIDLSKIEVNSSGNIIIPGRDGEPREKEQFNKKNAKKGEKTMNIVLPDLNDKEEGITRLSKVDYKKIYAIKRENGIYRTLQIDDSILLINILGENCQIIEKRDFDIDKAQKNYELEGNYDEFCIRVKNEKMQILLGKYIQDIDELPGKVMEFESEKSFKNWLKTNLDWA